MVNGRTKILITAICAFILVTDQVFAESLEDRLEKLFDRVSIENDLGNYQEVIELTGSGFFAELDYAELEVIQDYYWEAGKEPVLYDVGWNSMEQSYYLSIFLERGKAYVGMGDFSSAIPEYEFYLQESSYIWNIHYRECAHAYAEGGRYEDIDSLLLEAISRLKPTDFLWIYSTRQDLIDEYGAPGDAIVWAEKVYNVDPRAASVFDRASMEEFKTGHDEDGVLWFLRAISVQYDINGIDQFLFLFDPSMELFNRQVAGKDTSEIDFCLWFYNALYGWNSNLKERETIRKSAESSRWGEHITENSEASHLELLEVRRQIEGPDTRMVAIAYDASIHFRLMNEHEESLKYIRFVKKIILDNQSVGRSAKLEFERYETVILRDTGNYVAALEKQQILSREIGELYGYSSGNYALILLNIGTSQDRLGRYDAAIDSYSEAIGIAGESGANELQEQVTASLIATYIETEQYELAAPLLDKIVQLAEWRIHSDPEQVDGKFVWTLIGYLRLRARNYIELGLMDLAQTDYERFNELMGYLETINERSQIMEGTKLHNLYLTNIPTLLNLSFDIVDFGILSEDDNWDAVMENTRELMKSFSNLEGFRMTEGSLRAFHLLESRWYEYKGQIPESLGALEEATEGYMRLVDTQWDYLNEREKSAYLEKIKPVFRRYHNLAVRHGAEYPEVVRAAYETALRSKAILLRSGTEMRRFLQNEDLPPATRKTRDQWILVRTELAKYYCGFIENIDAVRLEELETKASTLERELTFFQSRNSDSAFSDIDSRSVTGNLQTDETAVEIVHLVDTGYIAYVAKADGAVHLIHICDESNAESFLEDWRYYIQSSLFRTDHDRLVPDPGRERLTQDIYRNLWQPLETTLAGSSRIYFSADGIFQLINPLTLVDEEGRYLDETFDFVMMITTADLVAGDTQSSTLVSGGQATLLGNPRYMRKEPVSEQFTLQDDTSDRSVDYYNRLDQSFTNVSPLPGTEIEVEGITDLLASAGVKTETLSDLEADEQRLKLVSSPDILHLATHGFFLEESEDGRKNPMLRSGLLLSGCENGYLQYGDSFEDGILTAYEALDLNLADTRLVVLSACETALGEIRSGEGVYGLQRSFLMAGAEHLLISLWSVSDSATADFMVAFYRAWLETGDIAEGYSQAIEEMRSIYHEPFFWGAFVLVER